MSLRTPEGRWLLRDLDVVLDGEHVAIVGRNGVGKSSLLAVLAGRASPQRGRVRAHVERALVQQELDHASGPEALCALFGRRPRAIINDAQLAVAFEAAGMRAPAHYLRGGGMSGGELRKWHLLAARYRRPGLLLLDEPTQDLDIAGVDWLGEWLDSWSQGLLVVSHHRQLLQRFRHFFIMEESGCSYLSGSFAQLEQELERRHGEGQRRYLRQLNVLVERERHNATVCRRRRRKKNLGRIHEEGRAPSKAQLRGKKSYAQQSQGKAAKIRRERLEGVRKWTLAARRALSVRLPLELLMPRLPPDDHRPLIALHNVAVERAGRELLSGLRLRLGRQRLGVIGPNGAGKSTLLEVMAGRRAPGLGSAKVAIEHLGYIAQAAAGWVSEETLGERLVRSAQLSSPEALAQLLVAHKFPLALAERPLRSVSPGERVRAALICLFQHQPVPELLLLDEPTYGLDFVGIAALSEALCAWPGGLVVASHDRGFLAAIGMTRCIELDGRGGHRIVERKIEPAGSSMPPR